MRTVAQKYIEEGTQYGIQIGKAEGKVEAMKAVAKTMLIKNKPLNEIIELTGLTKIQINKLK